MGTGARHHTYSALLATCAALAIALAGGPARAHDFALSNAVISPVDDEITMLFRLDPTSIVELLADRPWQGEANEEEKRAVDEGREWFWRYFGPRFQLLGDERPCTLPEGPDRFFYNPAIDRAVLTFKARCEAPVRVLEIRSTLFVDAPTPHQFVADLRYEGAVERYFFNERERVAKIDLQTLRRTDLDWRARAREREGAAANEVEPPPAPPPPEPAVAPAPPKGLLGTFSGFLVLGLEHIFGGLDHILFVLTLIVAVATWKDLVKIITSFTVAHSITLALGAFALVVIHPRLVEPIIAASIVYVGVENIVREEPRARFAVTFCFGLIHGFGFSEVIRELGLTGPDFAVSLLAFNLGVELGQLAIVCPLFPLILLLRKRERHYLWARRIVSGGAALVAALWFVERVAGVSIVS